MSQATYDPITTATPSRAGDDYVARLHALRRDLERGVDAMLELLETLDGDPDLEDGSDAEPDNDDEPSLGWGQERQDRLYTLRHDGEDEDGHDREATNEDGGDINDACQADDSELEPSAGAPENPEGDQTHWAQGDGFFDEAEAGISDDDNPAVNAAARTRSYQQREATVAAGREADRQLRVRDGVAYGGLSNVRMVAIGPDGMRYLVQGL